MGAAPDVAAPLRVSSREATGGHDVPSARTPCRLHSRLCRVRTGDARPDEQDITGAISAAIIDLYERVYGHHRTTTTTYLNGKIVLCVLEGILTKEEDALIADGSRGAVIDGRVAFQRTPRTTSPPRWSN